MDRKPSPVRVRRAIGVAVFTGLYPLVALALRHTSNPMVPGAILAFNMIFPVLAGYFFGPWSGAVAGAAGTAISAVVRGSPYDGLSILPHLIMGFVAGWAGTRHSDLVSSLAIVVGHVFNLGFYMGFGLLKVSATWFYTATLGLATEATIDIVAILLIITWLGSALYQTERW